MYRTYTYEKPARPHLGLVVSAGSLVLTLVAAYGLTRIRTGSIELGTAVRPPGWPIAFSAPREWVSAEEPAEAPDAAPDSRWDAISLTPRNAARRGVVLTVFHLRMHPGVALEALTGLIALQQLKSEDAARLSAEPAAVGPLLGLRTELRESVRHGWGSRVIAVACLPDGHAIGVSVAVAGVIGASERALLADVCRSIQPAAGSLDRAAPPNLPLRFTPPPHAWFGGDRAAWENGARLAADEGADFAWRVELSPTFLLPDRAPADLLRDYLANYEQRSVPTAPIQERSDGGRRTAAARLASAGGALDARVVELSPQRAAVLLGHAAESDEEPLAALCEALAASIQAEPAHWPFDVDPAVRRGAELMNDVRRGPLDAWLPQRPVSLDFVSEFGGDRLGAEQLTLSPPSRDTPAYSGRQVVTYGPPQRPELRIESRWSIDPRSLSLRITDRLQQRRDGVPSELSMQTRTEAPWREVALSIADNAAPRELVLKAPDNYLPDPLIAAVVASVGRAGQKSDAVFRVTSLDPGSLAAEYVQPVPLGDDPPDGAASAVVVRRDSIPRGRLSYFDAAGLPLKSVHSDASVTRRKPAESGGGDSLLRRLLGGS